MSSMMKSLLVTAAAAGVGYYLKNRPSLTWRRKTAETPERGTTIYDNHVAVE
jgi:hypothetical protein